MNDSVTQSENPTDRPAVPAPLRRDVEMLDEADREKARRLLDTVTAELGDMKESWVDDLIGVHEEFERACEGVRKERYQPARRDELLAAAREEFLGRLRRSFEKQNRRTSDYCLSLERRMRTIALPDRAPRDQSVETGLLRELLDLTKRTYAADMLARGDRREIARNWNRAERDNDTLMMDVISSNESEDLPPAVTAYGRRKEARRRLADAGELVRWIQRERTVAHAVYDSIVEAISRSGT